LIGAVVAAFDDVAHRLVAVVTFLVVASGIQVAGIGAAFWGLIAGGVVMLWLGVRRRRAAGAEQGEAADG
jgi:benzoate membrane transport protein